MSNKLNSYQNRLEQLEPIRHEYHAQKEKTIQTIVASVAGFSAFVFSTTDKITDGDAFVISIFFLFILVVYIYAAIFMNKQIYLKRGVAAQYAAISTDLWKIANNDLVEESIGLSDEYAATFIGKYGITGSVYSIKLWSKSYSETVKKAYKQHALKEVETILLLIMTTMSVLSLTNYIYTWNKKQFIIQEVTRWLCGT